MYLCLLFNHSFWGIAKLRQLDIHWTYSLDNTNQYQLVTPFYSKDALRALPLEPLLATSVSTMFVTQRCFREMVWKLYNAHTVQWTYNELYEPLRLTMLSGNGTLSGQGQRLETTWMNTQILGPIWQSETQVWNKTQVALWAELCRCCYYNGG